MHYTPDYDTPDGFPEDPAAQRVPIWLSALVFVLLVAVFSAAGVLYRAVMLERAKATPLGQGARIAVLERESRADPSDLEARLALGFAYQAAGRTKDALREYDGVLVSDSKNAPALYNKGTLLMTAGSTAEGEKALLGVLEINPVHVLAAERLGRFYAEEGRYEELLAIEKPVATAEPTVADLQYLTGLALEHLGQPASALEYYRQALAYVPDMADARAGLERLRGAK